MKGPSSCYLDQGNLGRELEVNDERVSLQPVLAAALMKEGLLFYRYLLGRKEADREVLERYAQACSVLFLSSPAPGDLGVFRFLDRRPWALPFLDAAAGLVDPDSLLRRKLLLIFAILETTPAYAEAFTPKPSLRLAVVARLIAWLMSSVLKALVGLVIYPLAKRTR